MTAYTFGRVRSLWRRTTRLDRAALAFVFLYALFGLAHAFQRELPLSRFIGFLFFLSLGYFLFRALAWARTGLLWSLRNRLIVAYLFIAVVPVLLLLVMVALSAYILYWQLGAYLIYDDLQKRIDKAAVVADAIVATFSARGSEPFAGRAAARPLSPMLDVERAELPGLEVEFNSGEELLRRQAGPNPQHFAGLVQSGEKVWLRAVAARPTPGGPVVVSVSVPVTPELLESVAPESGPLQLTVTRPAAEGEIQGSIGIGDRRFLLLRAGQVSTRRRAPPPRANWFDYLVDGVAKLDAVALGPGGASQGTNPVLVFFSARPSHLNRRLFSSLGEIGSATLTSLLFIGVVFLSLEVAALVAGIVLTRTITHAVADLYRATEDVQAGDLTHRVRIQRQDQLGALAESFNTMTSSISTLIEEQRQRQRMENELSIAREVQAQLFPQVLPSLPGIKLEAMCRAARVVSGDYYDFIRLGPTRLGIAIGDISGKGISAALLMASLQAALHSQVLVDGGSAQSTAELVARLNRYLFLNTSPERYATFFFAVYDAATRTLRYTNAGHLPPLCIVSERVTKLEDGGMVIGLFDDCTYDQGTMQIEPGSVLLAYSDGLVEPENVYGEEFSSQRLIELAVRHRHASPHALAETLITAAEEWGGSPEQADDMTVIVARLE